MAIKMPSVPDQMQKSDDKAKISDPERKNIFLP